MLFICSIHVLLISSLVCLPKYKLVTSSNCGTPENCILPGYYTVSSGNSLPTFRDQKLLPVGCPEMLVRSYHYLLRNYPEERTSHLLYNRSLKSCCGTRITFSVFLSLPVLQLQMFSSELFTNNLHQCSFLGLKGQVTCLYKTTGIL
jgi:hypothetical protein